MNKPCAIVVVYNGTADITPQAAHNIIQTMFDNGVTPTPNSAELKAFDTDAITSMIIESLISGIDKPEVKVVNLKDRKTDRNEEIENAFVFLGTMYAESLKKGKETGNYGEFAMSLMLGIDDEKVLNAIEILSTKCGKVSKAKWNTYNMTPAALDVIKDVYKSHPKFLCRHNLM
jgi:hypothetical protein